MPVWTARCRNQDPGCVSMGAIQRGTSWATIPKTLNRARTVHAPCAHRARTVRQRPLGGIKPPWGGFITPKGVVLTRGVVLSPIRGGFIPHKGWLYPPKGVVLSPKKGGFIPHKSGHKTTQGGFKGGFIPHLGVVLCPGPLVQSPPLIIFKTMSYFAYSKFPPLCCHHYPVKLSILVPQAVPARVGWGGTLLFCAASFPHPCVSVNCHNYPLPTLCCTAVAFAYPSGGEGGEGTVILTFFLFSLNGNKNAVCLCEYCLCTVWWASALLPVSIYMQCAVGACGRAGQGRASQPNIWFFFATSAP